MKETILLGSVSQDSPQRKSMLREDGKLGSNYTSQVLKDHDASRKNSGKEGSITSGASPVGSNIRGKNARRNPQTKTVRLRSGLELGYGCL